MSIFITIDSNKKMAIFVLHYIFHKIYSGGALSASSGAAYGEGSGKIWLDSLGCTGNETRLSECSSDGYVSG